MDIIDLTANKVSSDFSPDNITKKVIAAYYHCSAIFGERITVSETVNDPFTSSKLTTPATYEGDSQGNAISMLAEAMLIESRKILKLKDNPNLVIRTTAQLFTDEMRDMLIDADVTPEDDIAEESMWSNKGPTEGWDLGASSTNLR